MKIISPINWVQCSVTGMVIISKENPLTEITQLYSKVNLKGIAESVIQRYNLMYTHEQNVLLEYDPQR